MPVESAADRAIFLSTNDFGVSATFTHFAEGLFDSRAGQFDSTPGDFDDTTGVSVTVISGIFDNDFVEVDAGGTISFAMQQPRFITQTDDVSVAIENDTLLITGTTYKIRVVQPDGTGMTNLILEKQ